VKIGQIARGNYYVQLLLIQTQTCGENMDNGIASLIKFLADAKSESECSRYFSVAIDSFFEELMQEEGGLSLEDIELILGEEAYNQIYPCMMEYFFSTDCPDVDDDGYWNIIDSFLKSRGRALSQKQKDYLVNLRNSHMSIYEVVDMVPDKSITLKDLIQNKPKVVVTEKMATIGAVKWDRLAARLIKQGDKTVLSGGGLNLRKDCADEVIDFLKTMHKEMKKAITPAMLKEFGLSAEEMDSMQKKIWAKEISMAWMMDALEKPKLDASRMTNSDGHQLQFCTIQFPIKGSKKKLEKLLDNLPEIAPDGEFAWLWPVENKGDKARGKTAYFETHVQNEGDKKTYKVFATMEIKGKKLIIQTNSYQRANIAEEYYKRNLGDLVGKSLISIENIEKILNSLGAHEPKQSEIPLEEQIKIITEMKNSHYADWLDVKLPALKNKTPRSAAKTKIGRQRLVDLLKDMQNTELSRTKRENIGEHAYDFSWMWEELGITAR